MTNVVSESESDRDAGMCDARASESIVILSEITRVYIHMSLNIIRHIITMKKLKRHTIFIIDMYFF